MRDYKGRSSNLYLRDRRRSSPRGLIWGLIVLLIAGLAVGAWFLSADDPASDTDPAAAPPDQATAAPTPPRPANIIPLKLPPPRATTPPDAQPANPPTTGPAEAPTESTSD